MTAVETNNELYSIKSSRVFYCSDFLKLIIIKANCSISIRIIFQLLNYSIKLDHRDEIAFFKHDL